MQIEDKQEICRWRKNVKQLKRTSGKKKTEKANLIPICLYKAKDKTYYERTANSYNMEEQKGVILQINEDDREAD